jgi:hypothetical protein
LFDYMKNNSPQRARKRSFKYMIYWFGTRHNISLNEPTTPLSSVSIPNTTFHHHHYLMYDFYAELLCCNNLQRFLSKTRSLVDESEDPHTTTQLTITTQQ